MGNTKQITNKMKYVFFVVVVLVFSFNLTFSTSYACDCVIPNNIGKELERSSAVFMGEVIDIKNENENGEFRYSDDPLTALF